MAQQGFLNQRQTDWLTHPNVGIFVWNLGISTTRYEYLENVPLVVKQHQSMYLQRRASGRSVIPQVQDNGGEVRAFSHPGHHPSPRLQGTSETTHTSATMARQVHQRGAEMAQGEAEIKPSSSPNVMFNKNTYKQSFRWMLVYSKNFGGNRTEYGTTVKRAHQHDFMTVLLQQIIIMKNWLATTTVTPVVFKPVLQAGLKLFCPAHFVCLPCQTHLIQALQSLLTSWWVESGVSDKGDIQNVQGRGACRTGLKTVVIPRLVCTRKQSQIQIF